MNLMEYCQSSSTSRSYFFFIVIFLGMMSAFGPFITDMYLPTLPMMQQVFNTTESMVQLGLSTAMIGLAVGQIFFGPISEKYGRKPLLIISMIIFSASAFASVFSPTIEFFLICRFFQGIGGAGGVVISRSISTDLYKGRDLAKMMGIIGAVHGVAPVAAPVIGGLVSGSIGWKGIFLILLAIGLVLLAMCFKFTESLPMQMRIKGNLIDTFKGFKSVLKIRAFVLPLIAFASSYGILFGYIASSPFIIQNHYGFSQLMFSIIFGTNAIALAIGATLAIRFKSLVHSLFYASLIVVLLTTAQLVCSLYLDSFYCFEALIWLTLLCLGCIFTSGSTLAMEAGRVSIGSASALVGSIGFIIGGIVSPLVGIGEIMITSSILYVISGCSVALFSYILWNKMKGYSVI